MIPEVPPLGPSCNCHEHSGGKDGMAEKGLARTPEIPPFHLNQMVANSTLFDALAAKCIKPKQMRAIEKDWISEGTWNLIAKRASLMCSGKIRQAAAWWMQREVKAALKADKSRLTSNVGESIVLVLCKGKVQEAGSIPAPERMAPEHLGGSGQALPSDDEVPNR